MLFPELDERVEGIEWERGRRQAFMRDLSRDLKRDLGRDAGRNSGRNSGCENNVNTIRSMRTDHNGLLNVRRA